MFGAEEQSSAPFCVGVGHVMRLPVSLSCRLVDLNDLSPVSTKRKFG